MFSILLAAQVLKILVQGHNFVISSLVGYQECTSMRTLCRIIVANTSLPCGPCGSEPMWVGKLMAIYDHCLGPRFFWAQFRNLIMGMILKVNQVAIGAILIRLV